MIRQRRMRELRIGPGTAGTLRQPATESHDQFPECNSREDSVVNGLRRAGSRVVRYIASALVRAEIASSTAISA